MTRTSRILGLLFLPGLLVASLASCGPIDDESPDTVGKGDAVSVAFPCEEFIDRIHDCVAVNYIDSFAEAFDYCEGSRLFYLHRSRCDARPKKPDWCDYDVFKADYWPACRRETMGD